MPVVVSAIFVAFLGETMWRLYMDRPTSRSINLLRPFACFACCGKPFRRHARRSDGSGINTPNSDEIALNEIKPASRVSRNSEGQPIINGAARRATASYQAGGGDLIFGQGEKGTTKQYKTMLLVMAFTTVAIIAR